MVEEVNANGGWLGRQVEAVGYDTKGDSMEAVNAVKRLTSQDKVVAIIGPNASGQAIAISSVLEEAQVPEIATVATNPKVTVAEDGSVKPYNFRVCFIDPYQGAVAAGYAFDKIRFRKRCHFFMMLQMSTHKVLLNSSKKHLKKKVVLLLLKKHLNLAM